MKPKPNPHNSTARGPFLMTVTVLSWSWYPLVVTSFGPQTGPFVYIFWNHLTVNLLFLLFGYWANPNLFRTKQTWTQLIRLTHTRDGLCAVTVGAGSILYLAAAHFVDVALVAVITSTWPILFVISQKRLDITGRYHKPRTQQWVLFTVALTGVTAVTLSQTGGTPTGQPTQHLLYGTTFAAAAAACLALNAYRFKIGTQLHNLTHPSTRTNPERDELACQAITSAVTGAPVVAVALLLGITGAFGTPTTLLTPTAPWIIAASLLSFTGGLFFRHANIVSTNLGTNAIYYLQLPLEILWLAVFAALTLPRTDWLIIGVAAIAASGTLNSINHITKTSKRLPSQPDADTYQHKHAHSKQRIPL